MNIRLKMKGATPGAEDLCETCRHCFRSRSRSGRDTVVCNALSPVRMEEPIAECNFYTDKRHPELWAMREIAWPLAVDKKGGIAGFKSPEEFERLKAEKGWTRGGIDVDS